LASSGTWLPGKAAATDVAALRVEDVGVGGDVLERAHGGGVEDAAAAADDRPVLGVVVGENPVGGAGHLDTDDFGLEVQPGAIMQVLEGIKKIQGLDVDVGGIDAVVRHRPGKEVVGAHRYARITEEGGAGDVDTGIVKVCFVPLHAAGPGQVGVAVEDRGAGARLPRPD